MSKKQIPDTSKDAFKSLEPDKIRLMYKKILTALQGAGLATYEEVAILLNEKPERIWKRLPEMLKLGLVHRPGERKVMSSGRQGFVWKIGSGIDVTKQRKKVMKGPTVSDFSKAILKQPKPSDNTVNRLF